MEIHPSVPQQWKGNNSISLPLLPLPALPSQAADLSLEKPSSDARGLLTIQATDFLFLFLPNI